MSGGEDQAEIGLSLQPGKITMDDGRSLLLLGATMAEEKASTFTAQGFLQKLHSDAFVAFVEMVGMAKKAEGDTESLMFSPGTSCGNWVKVPASQIEKVELIKVVGCQDHSHPLVRLFLKPPTSAEGTLFHLLGENMSRSSPPAMPQKGAGVPRRRQPRQIGAVEGQGAHQQLAELLTQFFNGPSCVRRCYCSDNDITFCQPEGSNEWYAAHKGDYGDPDCPIGYPC